MNNEIYITKDTKLSKIKDKEKYTKMIIQTKIHPNKLKEFINIKELVIDYIDKKDSNYNVENINLLPFKRNIEKITFNQVKYIGIIEHKTIFFGDETKDELNGFHNLKIIEFPPTIKKINCSYLDRVKDIKEIIFNFNNFTIMQNFFRLNLSDEYDIKLKYNEKEYIINPEYPINYIDNLRYDNAEEMIVLNFSQFSDILSRIEINTIIDEKVIKTKWKTKVIDGIIYIPDYVNSLELYEPIVAKKISLNLNLLNEVKNNNQLIHEGCCRILKTIELRSSNEMNLFPNKIINIEDYGILEDLYIEEHLLCLEFNTCKITINSKGEINKQERVLKSNKLFKTEGNLTEEIIDYLCYKRFLEFIKREINNQETQEALQIIEENVKKLIK